MSVRVADRKESKMQYVQTARELLKYSLQKSLKFPKRYTFFITTRLVNAAQDIYERVCMIEALYSHTEQHKLRRIELCEECIGILHYLASQLDIVELFITEIQPKAFARWIEIIDYEERLLRGVIEKNK